jgi:hypothetical protein
LFLTPKPLDYQALKVVYHYVCRGATLQAIADSGQPVYQQPQSVQQAQFPQQPVQQPTFAPSIPDSAKKSGVLSKRAASIGGAILFMVIIFAVFIFPRIGELSGGPLNSKNAVDEIQNFTPTLEFVDSVCASGDWSVNDRTTNLRVAFDGMSDSGAVQAMFDVDMDAGTVIATWYLSSKEIEAADLYRTFYQSE